MSDGPVLLAAAVVTLVATAAPGWAITYGVPAGNGHPAVGGLVADQAYSDGTWIYRSGTLVSPRCSARRRTARRVHGCA